MALATEVEKRVRLCMELVFGQGITVSTTVDGTTVRVVVSGANIQQAGRAEDPRVLRGLIRLAEQKFTPEEFEEIAHRRRETVEQVKTAVALDLGRDLAPAIDAPEAPIGAGQDRLDVRLMTVAERERAIDRRRDELLKELGGRDVLRGYFGDDWPVALRRLAQDDLEHGEAL